MKKTVCVSTLLVAPDLQHGSINGGKNIFLKKYFLNKFSFRSDDNEAKIT
jgi:hypothetical protein